MPSNTTVDIHFVTGRHFIPTKSTGHGKTTFTVIFKAQADGTKSKPCVVFKGGIVVRFTSNRWMNDSLTIDYVRTISLFTNIC